MEKRIRYEDEPVAAEACSIAILHLMEGNDVEALSLLHGALEATKMRLHCLEQQQHQPGQPGKQGTLRGNTLDASLFPVSLEDAFASDSDEANVSSSETIRMYRYIYEIQGEDSNSNALSPKVSIILLYNLAVIYHELGMASRRKALLRKAMVLYQFALRLVRHIQQLEQTRGDHHYRQTFNLVEIEAAILNNLSHTYSLFPYPEHSVSTREILRTFLFEHINEMGKEAYCFFQGLALTVAAAAPAA